MDMRASFKGLGLGLGRGLWVSGSGGVLLLATTASAQVSKDTAKLESVIVTATRSPLSIGDSPASVTVLNGTDLRARGVTTVSEALREVPGVVVSTTGSFGGQTSVFVR